MKSQSIHRYLVLGLGIHATANAGDSVTTYEPPAGETPVVENTQPDAFQWLTPSIDWRTRYEFRNLEGSPDPANSVTTRARVGLTLGTWNGFSAFGEVEATAALVDEFDGGPGNTTPNEPDTTAVADPENAELNRAWVQYKQNGLLAKVGRQRIIRNNAAFIGNVGWRQNEQTFDAAQLAYTAGDFWVAYAYSNRVQRIFGNDSGGAFEEFDGNFHFVDATYNTDLGKIGGYAYLAEVSNNVNVGRSNTFGGYATLGSFYGEFAVQDGDSDLVGGDGSYTSLYAHGNYTLKTDAGNFTAGVEWFEEDFKTPLATVHKFNGWADAFIGQRIGLNNANGFEGIFDAHIKYAKTGLPLGLTFKAAVHYFASADLGDTYGWEADALLVKKFGKNVTALAKGAYFFADSGSTFPDIQQVTVDLAYKF